MYLHGAVCVAYYFVDPNLWLLSANVLALIPFFLINFSFYNEIKDIGSAAYVDRFVTMNGKGLFISIFMFFFLYFNPFFVLYLKGYVVLSIIYLTLGILVLHWSIIYKFKIEPIIKKYNNIFENETH